MEPSLLSTLQRLQTLRKQPAPSSLTPLPLSLLADPSLHTRSDLRQVPDSQEVYLSNNSDLSIILEVLQLVEEEGAADDLDKAIR